MLKELTEDEVVEVWSKNKETIFIYNLFNKYNTQIKILFCDEDGFVRKIRGNTHALSIPNIQQIDYCYWRESPGIYLVVLDEPEIKVKARLEHAINKYGSEGRDKTMKEKRKALTKEEVIAAWEKDNNVIFKNKGAPAGQFSVVYLSDVGFLKRYHSNTGEKFQEWRNPTHEIVFVAFPADELREKLDALMETVTPENAVALAKEAYALKAEYFPQIGWKNTKEFLKEPFCPLCKIHLRRPDFFGPGICIKCPLGESPSKCADGSWKNCFKNPAPAAFLALRAKIDALPDEPEIKVEPGQVWTWHTIAGEIVIVNECCHTLTKPDLFFQPPSAFKEDNKHENLRLTDRRVVTIGPDQVIATKSVECDDEYVINGRWYKWSRGNKRPADCPKQPEPTLSYKYVEKNMSAKLYYSFVSWFHMDHKDNIPMDDVRYWVKHIVEYDDRKAVQDWLKKHGLLDEALQITGISK